MRHAKRHAWATWVLIGSLAALPACSGSNPSPSGQFPDTLKQELDQTTAQRLITARDAALQAQNAYSLLAGRFSTGSEIDATVFADVETQLLPPLQAAATAL